MKAIAKVLAPASLALAAFSANAAGLVETDYPLHQGDPAASVQASGTVSAGQPTLSWPISEAAPVVNTTESGKSVSREEVMRKAAEPRRFDLGYFA